MRTLIDVKTEIMKLTDELKTLELKKSQISRRKKRIQFLRLVEMYLDTAPDELYLELEIKKCVNKINALVSRIPSNSMRSEKTKLESELGIKTLRAQVRTLRFIKK